MAGFLLNEFSGCGYIYGWTTSTKLRVEIMMGDSKRVCFAERRKFRDAAQIFSRADRLSSSALCSREMLEGAGKARARRCDQGSPIGIILCSVN
jgi:hypothetical protein